MSTSVLDQMLSHLGFLGYEIVRKEKAIAAKHQRYFNLAIQELNFGVLFTTFFGINALGKRERNAVLESTNSFNRKAGVCRCYVDKDFDLAIEAVFPKVYDKSAFGLFLDAINRDSQLLGKEEVQLGKYLE